MIRPRGGVLPLLLLIAAASPAFGQSAENIAVVINTASADSERIGEHYASVRNVPASNILRIETTTAETIERDRTSGPSRCHLAGRSPALASKIGCCTLCSPGACHSESTARPA